MSEEEIARLARLHTTSQKLDAISDQLLLIAEQLISISLMLRVTSTKLQYANRPLLRSIGGWVKLSNKHKYLKR